MNKWIAGLLFAIAAYPQDSAQTADPAYAPLNRAYEALKVKDFDQAIEGFRKAVAASPRRPDIRKDLAYTYLKAGEPELAREQFGEAVKLAPADTQVALEFAFLCYESRTDPMTYKALARRIFERLGKQGSTVAETAFQNVDRPLAEGIERWIQALKIGPETFSAHYDLAQLAEQRDMLDLAAAHYLRAWQMLPARRSVLVDLGRVLLRAERVDEAHAALIAASRGPETRAAESARELLPARYPYVYEFRSAIALDGANVELHREFAYLLLKMAENAGERRAALQSEAEHEFVILVASAPDDLLSAAQLGFLYLARNDSEHAQPLLQRVLKGNDTELANRVRTALHLDPALESNPRPVASVTSEPTDPRVMAEKSYAAGYLKDTLRYLTIAYESAPHDASLMLKLGYTQNLLHNDPVALNWFSRARYTEDPEVSQAAKKAYNNLRPNLSRIRTTLWMFPFYSTRWNDNFAYAQTKTEIRFPGLPVHPYASVRFVGDTRDLGNAVAAQGLSESSFIVGAGVATDPWHRAVFWGEAGSSVSYLGQSMRKDLRGGIAWSRFWGVGLASDAPGAFIDATADGVFVSRFGNDTLGVVQGKFGFTMPVAGPVYWQLFVNTDVTQDSMRQYWANFFDVGPGVRWRIRGTPPSLLFSVSLLRGVYTHNQDNPRRPNFMDVRAGFWYAFTR